LAGESAIYRARSTVEIAVQEVPRWIVRGAIENVESVKTGFDTEAVGKEAVTVGQTDVCKKQEV
jgi:hypothetical protein